jgi:hypothetical protein
LGRGGGHTREGKRRGRGAVTGEGDRRVREALHERKKHKGTVDTTIEVFHPGRRPSLEPRRKSVD